MGNKCHTLAVFIGRFQPFHIGHRHVLDALSGDVDSTLVLVGSAYRPRSWKNPFTFAERRDFIRAGTQDLRMPVDILPLIDTLYNDRSWASNVRTAVRLYLRAKGLIEDQVRIVLTGFEKDSSSRYLSWFPEWEMRPADPSRHKGKIVNATDLREALFFPGGEEFGKVSERFGNREVAQAAAWVKTNPKATEAIQAEGAYNKAYIDKTRRAEREFGYPIPINTSDSVVIQSGHVLLVRRGVQPGKSTLALPGGHIARGETSLKAAIRELYEETRLDMPKGVLEGRLRSRKIFDHPERSERGWVRTEAFFFELQDRKHMEKVRGGDDAAEELGGKAIWVPLNEITPDEMFEDHFDILQTFVPEVATSYSSILMAHVAEIGR